MWRYSQCFPLAFTPFRCYSESTQYCIQHPRYKIQAKLTRRRENDHKETQQSPSARGLSADAFQELNPLSQKIKGSARRSSFEACAAVRMQRKRRRKFHGGHTKNSAEFLQDLRFFPCVSSQERCSAVWGRVFQTGGRQDDAYAPHGRQPGPNGGEDLRVTIEGLDGTTPIIARFLFAYLLWQAAPRALGDLGSF